MSEPRRIENYPAIAEETIAFWRDRGLTASDAWKALTGEYRCYVGWAQVEEFMVGWLMAEADP